MNGISNAEDAPSKSQQDSTEELLPVHHPLSARRTSIAIAGLLLLAGAGFWGLRSCSSAPPAQAGKNGRNQTTLVTVATVSQQTVPLQLQTIGTVQASATVAVTPQATGRITGVFFKKGQRVRKGDLLFTLDDRTQAASMQQAQGTVVRDQSQVDQARAARSRDAGLVRQAEATLAKDQAQAQLAQDQSDRYNSLYKQGAISQDQAQQYATNRRVSAATLQADQQAIANARDVVQGDAAAIRTAEAVVAADRGALNNTQVQSTYTQIFAPIDGRAGNILVTEGNVVQANSATPLVTITQVTPIQVSFSVPEARLSEIEQYMDNGKLRVAVTFPGSTTPVNGLLTFVNNTVDPTTGTIQLIGDFANPNGKLFPGQFVNTTLTLTQLRHAIVVPDRAVQTGPNGQFVFVVDPDDSTVESVTVTVGSSVSGLDVIQKGDLKPGDQVVTDGQANLVAGHQVRVKTPGRDRGNGSQETGDRTGNGNPTPNDATGRPASGNPSHATGGN